MADGSVTCPKMNPSLRIAFSFSGAKHIDYFQQGTSNCLSCLCQMLVQIIQQSVSSHSFLSYAIFSCFWLLAPLLFLPCFVEIVYQKIAAEQLSSNCPFLFFISSAPSPYLSFNSSHLLDFFLCFASGSLFVARKSGPFQVVLPIRRADLEMPMQLTLSLFFRYTFTSSSEVPSHSGTHFHSSALFFHKFYK